MCDSNDAMSSTAGFLQSREQEIGHGLDHDALSFRRFVHKGAKMGFVPGQQMSLAPPVTASRKIGLPLPGSSIGL